MTSLTHNPKTLSGRCYCGALCIQAPAPAQVVTYCHCSDCRRVTGGPVAAFAAFAPEVIEILPTWPDPVEINPGIKRWFCRTCGSAMAAWFDYLPDQIYVPLGVIDQIEDLQPALHCHADNAPHWLHLDDGLPRDNGSGRDYLHAQSAPDTGPTES
ncbi:GFA family protein [Falsiruegeria litorea]|uniref:GFA family protein n=1 Tax=Falsiruegeria litorea TaxID=1280831 RepID=UPI001F31E41E|nr:GFA family protein [Falsiruegeria litorea]